LVIDADGQEDIDWLVKITKIRILMTESCGLSVQDIDGDI
jgi:hypothetical protein